MSTSTASVVTGDALYLVCGQAFKSNPAAVITCEGSRKGAYEGDVCQTLHLAVSPEDTLTIWKYNNGYSVGRLKSDGRVFKDQSWRGSLDRAVTQQRKPPYDVTPGVPASVVDMVAAAVAIPEPSRLWGLLDAAGSVTALVFASLSLESGSHHFSIFTRPGNPESVEYFDLETFWQLHADGRIIDVNPALTDHASIWQLNRDERTYLLRYPEAGTEDLHPELSSMYILLEEGTSQVEILLPTHAELLEDVAAHRGLNITYRLRRKEIQKCLDEAEYKRLSEANTAAEEADPDYLDLSTPLATR